MSFVLRLPRKIHLGRSLQMSHACHRFWKCYKTFTPCSLLRRCTIPCACHAKRHLNLQKWSEHVVLLTCWLRNVLRATTACTFSTSKLPKVVWTCGVFIILTSTCASRHNGMHVFDISTSKSGPNLVCFVHFDFEMCFALQPRAIFHLSSGQLAPHPPTQCFATFLPSYLFAHLDLLLNFLFFDLVSSSLIFSDSSHLCFSSVHIVGSLASKLPSIKDFNWNHFAFNCFSF